MPRKQIELWDITSTSGHIKSKQQTFTLSKSSSNISIFDTRQPFNFTDTLFPLQTLFCYHERMSGSFKLIPVINRNMPIYKSLFPNKLSQITLSRHFWAISPDPKIKRSIRWLCVLQFKFGPKRYSVSFYCHCI